MGTAVALVWVPLLVVQGHDLRGSPGVILWNLPHHLLQSE